MGVDHLRVPVDGLGTRCDPADLGFETTDDIAPLEGTIGQERAETAVDLALGVRAPGYNLFISGLPGSGRNTALRAHLERVASEGSAPPDWAYVHNFSDPAQPSAIRMPCGIAKQFAHDMNGLVQSCRKDIRQAFESDRYAHSIEEVATQLQSKRQAITSQVEREAQAQSFILSATPSGATPVPMMQGRPMTQEEFEGLTEQTREDMRKKAEVLQYVVNRAAVEIRRVNKEAAEQVRGVDRELVRFTLTPTLDELRERYAQQADITGYLAQVEADMVENAEAFKADETVEPAGHSGAPSPRDEEVFARYRVNDLVDTSTCEGAPVVFEYSPTYYNLFGRVDYRARMGTFTTDLTMIKAGALHRANGGYLVVQARDLLTSPLSWETLKRCLRSRECRIENIGDQYSPLPAATLRPQPIPLDAKIILVGDPEVLRLLQVADEDFRRYFKVVADFDTWMDRTPENISKYAAFVAARARESGLLPFHKTAVARVVDYSSRLVEHQRKLTTRFMHIADLVTEADHWARDSQGPVVMGEHVARAIEQKRYRSSLTEDRLQEMIEEGTIHIATEGEATGQVNGLAVLAVGDYVFGKPSVITARVSVGQGRVLNVERETRLSGKLHDKGFMILTGYLQGKYGRDKPLFLSASIGFEQTYSEVDGDSASSTELYALISELSGLPIRQGIAVTGSVNQRGEVQPIGGAIYKIEGFFDVCRARGLKGDQGVMIPRDNLKNLVLRDEVVQAVEAGQFHVYAVSSIDEGIELLTGVPAGERGANGAYPEGTVHHLVEKRLGAMARVARRFTRRRDGGADHENGDGASQGPA